MLQRALPMQDAVQVVVKSKRVPSTCQELTAPVRKAKETHEALKHTNLRAWKEGFYKALPSYQMCNFVDGIRIAEH